MSDRYIYDIYYPKMYRLPFDFEAKFRYVHAVSSKLLARFSEEQLIRATRRLDEAVLASEIYLIDISIEQWADPDDLTDYSDSKDRFLHHAKQQNMDMSELLGLEKVSWAECFALGAMSILAYATRLEHCQKKQLAELKKKSMEEELDPDEAALEQFARQVDPDYSKSQNTEMMDLWTLAEYVVESSKLAALAASFGLSSNDYDVVLRKNSAKGGTKKAQRYAALKSLVVECYWEAHSHRSNRDAAKRIYQSLSESELLASDGRPVLTTDDPVKRLSEWIGKAKSEKTKLSKVTHQES